ncbi:sterol desaturase family protein [Synechococcus sp. AH-551-G15]|nr:sterol desaturase family protein [Synechococcus sp. AH-551-G15]
MKSLIVLIIGFGFISSKTALEGSSALPITKDFFSIFDGKPGSLFIICLPYIIVLFAEYFFRHKSDSILKRSVKPKTFTQQIIFNKKSRRDGWYFLFSFTNVPLLLLAIYTIGSHSLIQKLSPKASAFLQTIITRENLTNDIFIILLLIVGITISELSSYIRHHCLHNNNILWKSHEFHHCAESMNVLNITRNANSDNIPNLLVLPISLLGVTITSTALLAGSTSAVTIYIFYMIIHNINNYLGHSSLYYKHPFPLNKIFMSPYHHWVHHSSDQAHHGKNLNTTFLLWDKVFGTYKDISSTEALNLKFGVKSTSYNKYNPFIEFYVLPYFLVYKEILNGIVKLSKNKSHINVVKTEPRTIRSITTKI